MRRKYLRCLVNRRLWLHEKISLNSRANDGGPCRYRLPAGQASRIEVTHHVLQIVSAREMNIRIVASYKAINLVDGQLWPPGVKSGEYANFDQEMLDLVSLDVFPGLNVVVRIFHCDMIGNTENTIDRCLPRSWGSI